ncbi:MAG: response regulator [bacterium]
MKILIIDDSLFALGVFKTTIESLGYKVIIAAGGKKGLEKYKEERPDIIICDILMPEIDGYTVIREVRETNKIIPIIAVTADVQKSTSRLLEDMGVTEILSKPFDIEKIKNIFYQMERGLNI